MESVFSFVIAAYTHLDGTLDIQIYDDCVDQVDALVTYAEDEGYHDIPDVVGLKDEDAFNTMMHWFEDSDVSVAVKQL